MDFHFSPGEESFRVQVRDFLREELPLDWAVSTGVDDERESDEMCARARAMAVKLGKKGWLSLAWPPQYGGLGRSHMDQLVFAEEMGYHKAPGVDVFGVKMVAPTLMAFGTEAQKRKHLAPIARGEVLWCEGFSEPGAGSDLAGLQTVAREEGDHFVINGQKVWTTGAQYADWCFMLARTDPQASRHRGISFFLMDMRSPGITVRPLGNLAGGFSFNEVFLDGVRVPGENLVGEKDRGWYVAMALLSFERSGIERIALGRRLLEELLEYLKALPQLERRRIGRALHSRLAETGVELEVARLLAYRVAWMQGKGLVPDSEAAMCKVFATELLQRLAGVGMQVLGLHGQIDHPSPSATLRGQIERLYLTSLARTIAAGTSEVQRDIIAARGLGLPRR